MKRGFILILFALIQVKGSAYAQKITLAVRDASLEAVLKQIRAQSGYDFFYNSALIRQAKPVTVNIKDASLEEALKETFRNQALSYTIDAKAVVVRKLSQKLTPSLIEVRGKVVDDKGEGLPGVTIKIVGSDRGTATDEEGRFTMRNVGEDGIIRISFLGFKPRELPAKPDLDTIRLDIDNANLNEVVVVGYGVVRKGDVTGAITSIKPDETEASEALSVENILQGKVAGLSVNTTSPSPGAAASITIRGANSLRGDNQPLYVIDNIPQGSTGELPVSAFGGGDYEIAQSPLTNLNPADIEDIQILKDASATAIYGSRGANGVILITTRKGKAGKTEIKASANYSVVSATNLRKMMTLQEFAAYRNEQLAPAAQQFFHVGDEMRYVFSDQTYDPNDPATYRVITPRDWQDEIYHKSLSQNYDVMLSGGSPNLKYYLSADHKNIHGMVEKTGLKQSGLRLNLSGNISPKLEFNASMSGILKENNMMAGGNSRGGATGSIARTAIDAAPFEIPADDPQLTSNEEARATTLAWLNDYDDITSEKTVRVAADLTWKISEKFSYNLRSGGNLMLRDRTRWYGLQLFLGYNNNGYLGISNLNGNNYTVENLLNFKHTVRKVVEINATVGATYDDYNWLNRLTTASDFEFKDLRTRGLHMASLVNQQQPAQRDYQLLSYLGRVNLSFLDGRYLATVTARLDGSSKFNTANRWALFPSFAFAWRMEQEDFLQNAPWVSQLKLRVGYGKTGSQSISPYNSFYNYDQIVDYANAAGDKELAIAVGNLQNSGLKWESTYAYNGGLDFSFFSARIGGNIDLYYKKTQDLLIEKALPTSTSFNTITLNQGSLSNRGIELSLKADIFRSKDIKWSLHGNISFNKSKILDLGYPEAKFGNETYRAYLGNSIGDHFGVANIFIAGKEPGLFWGYKTDGVIQTADTDLPRSNIFTQTPGNIRVVDVTGDGIINANDKTIIGNPNPDFNYGFRTSINFKRLSFTASFYGMVGNEIVNGNIRYEQTPSIVVNNVSSYAFQNRWTPANPTDLFPSAISNLQNVVYDRYVEDGSFLRCSDITFSYSFAVPRLVDSDRSLQVFASAKNLFILSGYSGQDPEMRTFAFDGLRPGVDLNSYSNPRQLIVGINVSF